MEKTDQTKQHKGNSKLILCGALALVIITLQVLVLINLKQTQKDLTAEQQKLREEVHLSIEQLGIKIGIKIDAKAVELTELTKMTQQSNVTKQSTDDSLVIDSAISRYMEEIEQAAGTLTVSDLEQIEGSESDEGLESDETASPEQID